MATVNVELTFDQLLAAIRKLPKTQKMRLWQTLDAELNRAEIRRRARAAIEAIWADNEGVNEDEVMADIDQALQEVRAQDATRRS